MKTAMQEMIQSINDIESKTIDQEQIYMLTALEIAALILLEKEKEQMLDFGLYVKKNGWIGCKIEDLYEDYNNQNK